MPKPDDTPSTDISEIEALMARLEAGQLREGDTQTLHRLLRTFLSLVHLLRAQERFHCTAQATIVWSTLGHARRCGDPAGD